MAVDMSDLVEQYILESLRIRDAAADVVLDSCRADCPVSPPTPTNLNPGVLRDSLEIEEVGDATPVLSVTIGSPLRYAEFTDEVDGDAHPIVATNAPFLRFWWDHPRFGPGIYEFLYVNHPGTTGQHWFASKNADRWHSALEDAVQ